MSTRLNVNLTFTADTTAAKASLQQLQTNLNQLSSNAAMGRLGTSLSTEINKGIQSATQLQSVLKTAVNTDTGKLDLTKFSQGLKTMGTDLPSLQNNLSALGTKGQQAFQSLAQNIVSAQVPLRKTNTMMDGLWTTMKNTMKWQISSAILSAFTRGISDAFNYAKELNESLNNIQIVTGYSADRMAEFAIEANKAAKALSTTTTEYTNASLIYYQQGLNTKEVKERADVTIKMANVTGESADTVSQWMTAVWNNFDDGSKKLEYYADAMTALGAATASSADEIAQGLEKFSAVADTVGLSYEYATAALATVTAQTRQSADVVGTAFKTLFARIQDLKFGETLENGTTLGQYSANLAKVGVNIKEASGELKNMDVILDELGARWKTLDKDQQVALAKGVAGLRQYNQFIALMDNWDYMQQNIKVAESSLGTLQNQQDIYAESWEAANQRVKASAQEIYSSLIDDKFFIGLTDGFSSFLEFLGKVIKSLGGLKGVLPALGAALTGLFGQKIITAAREFFGTMSAGSAAAQTAALNMKNQAINLMAQNQGFDPRTAPKTSEVSMLNQELSLQKELFTFNYELTTQEQEKVNILFDQLTLLRQQVIEQKKLQETGLQTAQTNKNALMDGLSGNNKKVFEAMYKANAKNIKEAAALDDEFSKATTKEQQEAFLEEHENYKKYLGDPDDNGIRRRIEGQSAAADATAKANQNLIDNYQKLGGTTENATNLIGGMTQGLKDNAEGVYGASRSADVFTNSVNEAGTAIGEMRKIPLSQQLMTWGQGIMQVSMGLSALSSIKDTLENTDLSIWEKFTSVTMSFSMVCMMLIPGLKTLNGALLKTSFGAKLLGDEYIKTILATEALDREQKQMALSQAMNISLKEAELIIGNEQLKQKITEIALDQEKNAEDKKKAIAAALNISLEEAENYLTAAQNGLDLTSVTLKKTKNKELAKENMGLLANTKQLGKNALAKAKNLIVTNLSLIAIGAWIVAILAAVKVIKQINKNLDANKDAAKAAQEEAHDLAETLNEVKSSFEDLKSSITNYDTSVEALTKLRQGTKEWNEEVNKLNSNVLELLQKYPELASYIDTTGGVYSIRPEGLQALYQQEAQNLQLTTALSAAANLNAKRASIEYEKELIADKSGISSKDVKTIVKAFEESGEKIFTSAYNGQTNGIFDTLKIDDEDLQEEMRNLTSAIKELEAAEKAQDNINLANLLSLYENVNMSEYRGYGKEYVENKYRQDISTHRETASNYELYQTDTEEITAAAGWFTGAGLLTAGLLLESIPLIGQIIGTALILTGVGFGIAEAVEDNRELTADSEKLLKNYLAEVKGIDKGLLEELKYETTSSGNIEIEGAVKEALGDSGVVTEDQLREYYAQLQVNGAYYANLVAEQGHFLQDLRADISYKKHDGDKDTNATASEKALLSFLETGNLNDYFGSGGEAFDWGEMEQLIESLPDAFGAAEQVLTEVINAANNWINMSSEEKNSAIIQAKQNKKLTFDQAISNRAQELGISANALEAYADTLVRTNSELENNSEAVAEMAAANYKMAQGIKKTRDTFEKWKETLSDPSDIYDYNMAVGELADSMTEAFGFEISPAFVKANLSKIKGMVDGSVEAFQELKRASIDEFLKNIVIDNSIMEDFKKQIDEIMDEIENKDLTISGSIDLSDKDFISTLNSLSAAGKITMQEIQGLFSAMDISLPTDQIQMITIPTVSKNKTTSWIKTGADKPILQQTTQIVEGTTQVPWIGDNPPQFRAVTAQEYLDRKGTDNQVDFSGSDLSAEVEDGGFLSNAGSLSLTAAVVGYEQVNDTGNTNNVSGIVGSGDLASLLNFDGGEDARKKARENNKKEIERYHEINEELEEIERNLKRIQSAKERAWGKDKLDLIEKEKKSLEEEIKTQEEFLKQINSKLIEDKIAAAKQGAKFDIEGKVINYTELLEENVGLSEDEFKKLKESLDKYEQTLDKAKDTQQDFIENQYKLEDLSLEAITYEIEYKVEISDYDREIIEFMMKSLEDDAFKTAQSLKLYGEQFNSNLQDIDLSENGIKRILEENEATSEQIKDFFAGNPMAIKDLDLNENEINQIMTYGKDMMSSASDAKEAFEEIENSIETSWEAMGEEFDKLDEKIQNLTSTVQNYRNIIDLVGKEKLGITDVEIDKINQSLIKNAEAQVQIAKNERNVAESTLNLAKETLSNLKEGTSEYDYWKDRVDYLENELTISEAKLQEALKSQLEAIKQQWEDSIDNIVEQFDKAMGSIYGSIENASKAFDRHKTISELYLQDYEKAYETSKLLREIDKNLDTTDNLKAQRQLVELQEQITKFQASGTKMSKLDLEYLQKRYDLKLAEIALEEAQNAKSQVSLQRDAAGNYGYVYTADEDKISENQAKYDEALYNYQDWAYEKEIELMDSYLSALSSYLDDVETLKNMYGENTAAFYRELEELDNYYREFLGYNIQEYANLMGYNMSVNAEYLTNLADNYHVSLIGQMYPDVNNFTDLSLLCFNLINEKTIELSGAYDNMEYLTSQALKDAGYSAEYFKNKLVGENGNSGYLGQVNKKVNTLAEDSLSMEVDFTSAMSGIINYLSINYSSFSDWMDEYIKKVAGFNTAFKEFLDYKNNNNNSNNSVKITFKSNPDVDRDTFHGKEEYTIQTDNKGKVSPEDTSGTALGLNQPGGYVFAGFSTDKEGKNGIISLSQLQNIEHKNNTTYYPIFTEKDTDGDGVPDINDYDIYDPKVQKEPYSQILSSPISSFQQTYSATSDTMYGEKWPTTGTVLISDKADMNKNNIPSGYRTKDWTNTEFQTYSSTGTPYSSLVPNVALLGAKYGMTSGKTLNGEKYIYLEGLGVSSSANRYIKLDDLKRLVPAITDAVFSNTSFSSFDTGGYTGSWGTEGRWAMLHQKEIILNAHDTENFLDVVKMVRDMQEVNFDKTLKQFIQTIARNTNNIQNNQNATKQDIYITAEFPDVTDRNEIEAAFNSLINEANQYVNKL